MPASGPKVRAAAARITVLLLIAYEKLSRGPLTAVPIGDQSVAASAARAAASEFRGARNAARHRIRQR